MTPRRLRALVLLLATALVTAAAAQAPPPSVDAADRAGRVRGNLDGLREGERDGGEQGRLQVLVDEFIRGFSRGVHELASDRAVDEAWAAGREESWDSGHSEGLERGRATGREAASDAYARLQGRPSFRPERAPRPDVPDVPDDARQCPPVEVVTVDAGRGRAVRLDLSDLERRGSPLPPDIPRPRRPSRDWMSAAARSEGYVDAPGIAAWSRAYEDAFERGYDEGYERAMDDVSHSARSRSEDDGRFAGRREGERRARCDAFARGHREGFADGWEEGFEQGFEEGWAEAAAVHDASAVVLLESADLRDGTDDGILEPGEDMAARMTLVNAGLADSSETPLAWRGLQGTDARGRISGTLRAQSRRTEDAILGAVDGLALLGSSVVVRFEPQGGESTEVKLLVRRPAEMGDPVASVEAREGRPVAIVRTVVSNVSRSAVDRGLRLLGEGVAADVGALAPGASTTVELVSPLEESTAVLGPARGTVRLEDASARPWMQRDWSARLSMTDAIALVGRLAAPDRAAGAVSRRLRSEYENALLDPKLYSRLGAQSELSQLARARVLLDGEAARVIDAQVVAPLLRDSQAKSVPRRVRKAVKDALGTR